MAVFLEGFVYLAEEEISIFLAENGELLVFFYV